MPPTKVLLSAGVKAPMCPTLKTFSAMSPPLGHTHIPYSSFSTVKMSYADALRGWRTVTAFDGAGDTCSRGQVCDSVSEICRNRGDSSVFRLSPSVFSNCLRRTLICFRRPTAGVKGVCPLSPSFSARFKSRYMQPESIASRRCWALSERATSETPGGRLMPSESQK